MFYPAGATATRSLCFLHRVAATKNTEQKSLFIHLVYNGDEKADRYGARLPTWMDCRSGFILPVDFVPGDRQNWIGKVTFIESKSKC